MKSQSSGSFSCHTGNNFQELKPFAAVTIVFFPTTAVYEAGT